MGNAILFLFYFIPQTTECDVWRHRSTERRKRTIFTLDSKSSSKVVLLENTEKTNSWLCESNIGASVNLYYIASVVLPADGFNNIFVLCCLEKADEMILYFEFPRKFLYLTATLISAIVMQFCDVWLKWLKYKPIIDFNCWLILGRWAVHLKNQNKKFPLKTQMSNKISISHFMKHLISISRQKHERGTPPQHKMVINQHRKKSKTICFDWKRFFFSSQLLISILLKLILIHT